MPDSAPNSEQSSPMNSDENQCAFALNGNHSACVLSAWCLLSGIQWADNPGRQTEDKQPAYICHIHIGQVNRKQPTIRC